MCRISLRSDRRGRRRCCRPTEPEGSLKMHHPTPHAWRGRLRGGWLGIILVPAIAGACSSSGATAPLTASVPPAAAATASIARSAAASTASAPPAAGGASGSACNLLTASDIQSVTGAASATVIGDKPGLTGDNVCVWQLFGGSGVTDSACRGRGHRLGRPRPRTLPCPAGCAGSRPAQGRRRSTRARPRRIRSRGTEERPRA